MFIYCVVAETFIYQNHWDYTTASGKRGEFRFSSVKHAGWRALHHSMALGGALDATWWLAFFIFLPIFFIFAIFSQSNFIENRNTLKPTFINMRRQQLNATWHQLKKRSRKWTGRSHLFLLWILFYQEIYLLHFQITLS